MTNPVLDDLYEIDSKIPGGDTVMARYAALSAEVARQPGARLDVGYGSDPRHKLDVFPVASGGQGRPLILFYHGGYWTGGAKESRRFPAPAWNARGVAWASVEYRLTPAVTLDDLVDDVRRALAFAHANARAWGCDPSSIHVCGNSAGGHIVAMLAASGWQSGYDVPDDVVRSATAISGLFDLAPLTDTFVNAWLKLDRAAVQRLSPIHIPPPRRGLPVVVSWGGKESSAFAEQSQRYAAFCKEAGSSVVVADRPAADHFSIIGELADPSSPLFAAMARAVDRGAA